MLISTLHTQDLLTFQSFIKLESLESLSDGMKKEYEELALEIFTR